jgi:fatty-acyl-CoA synthase
MDLSLETPSCTVWQFERDPVFSSGLELAMTGLMMNSALTLTAVTRRAETLFPEREIFSESPDGTSERVTYRHVIGRAQQLAVALSKLGLKPGDRVATLCWNHKRHFEAYLGLTAGGFVLHTLNLRLHPKDLAFIVGHAEDRALIIDEVLLPLLEQFRKQVALEHVVVVNATRPVPPGCIEYEQLLADANVRHFSYPDLDEQAPAALCYTSGTTGNPKGVLYSHRALALHTFAFTMKDVIGVGEEDVLFPVVPMFHANAWGIPFVGTLTGAKQILTGPHFHAPHLVQLLERERVTITGGVPTIWLGVLQYLDAHPGEHCLDSIRTIMIGGSAVPPALIQGMQERHGLYIVQLWGMTEMSPLGTMGHLPSTLRCKPLEEQYAYRARQGVPLPFIEIRGRGPEGLIPWDGKAVGELEVRGPWVARAYYRPLEPINTFTDDGWFRTGDIVTIDENGCILLQDRAKDLIKSGGEWISSVALENALMGHPAVAVAAVVAVAHPKWDERPLAVVVLKPACAVTPEELRSFLEPHFAKWWLPDAYVFADEIPLTGAGKFLKRELRQRYCDYYSS